MPASDDTACLRRWPYPFAHMITFASDVDGQSPWLGAAIHHKINHCLGLPVSDSVWVQVGNLPCKGAPSAFFTVQTELNRAPSGVDGHPAHGLLLRQWHRGNIDHLHSWQQDYGVHLVDRPRPAVPLSSGEVKLELDPPADEIRQHMTVTQLRLVFDRPPPRDLSLGLRDSNGTTIAVATEELHFSNSVGVGRQNYFAELWRPPATAGSRGRFDLTGLTRLVLKADEASAPVRIERDNFSRRTVKAQAAWLKKHNIRPAVTTSHGGHTQAQNFSPPGFVLTRAEPLFRLPQVKAELRSLADDKDAHAYHADLLHDLGVKHVWLYGGSKTFWHATAPPPRALDDFFYELSRSHLVTYLNHTREAFKAEVLRVEPLLGRIDLDALYCPEEGGRDQGVMLGLLIAAGLVRVAAGHPVDQLWYTHFASGDPDWPRTAQIPLKPSALEWLRRLAAHYYNVDGAVAQAHRVWVPPAGVAAQYRLIHAQIAAQVMVGDDSRVTIRSWTDPVTGRVLPEVNAGTRDLHGITVYVPAAAQARVFIDGREIRFFTRNGPDDTGRESITLVDDNTPTVVWDKIPLAALGSIRLTGVAPADAAGEPCLAMQVIQPGLARVDLRPFDLHFWNITHFFWEYRKSTRQANARLFVEFTTRAGHRFVIAEGQGDKPPRDGQGGWWVPPEATSNRVAAHTLALADMLWAVQSGAEANDLPLPLGRIDHIAVGLENAAKGDRFELGTLLALRPSSNGESATGGKLVAGRVIRKAGEPAGGREVRARTQDGRTLTTISDEHGYYFFYDIAKGDILAITVAENGKTFRPKGGLFVDVRKNEAEIDIVLAAGYRVKPPH